MKNQDLELDELEEEAIEPDNSPLMSGNVLRALIDLRNKTLQKNRIAFGNRLSALDRGADSTGKNERDILDKWFTRFGEMEKEIDRDIRDQAVDVPIIQEMVKIKGISWILAAQIVCMVDIHRADTVSALWRYCGYAVALDGKRERPVKGEKLHYNARLKTVLYLVGQSFIKSRSPYRAIYDSAKEYYEINRPDWTKDHRHKAAMRKMVKVFLAHTWMVWREMEGLPVRNLYVEEHQGHTHILAPEEFGWNVEK